MLHRVTAFAVIFGVAAAPALAEPIKVGASPIIANGAVYIAMDRGYFTAENLDVDLVSVQTPAAYAAGVASGAIDFAVTGNSVAMYALAGQGQLRIIGGQTREFPGFRNNAWAVSRAAYDAGFKTYRDIVGHSMAVTSIGSPGQYALSLMARKLGFDAASVQIKAMESAANSVSALAGGQVDASIIPASTIAQEVARGTVKIIGWVGDETPWQVGSVFTSTKLADNNPERVQRFLRALRHGTHDYHDAFTGPGETRQDQKTSPEILAIFTKYFKQTPDTIELSIPYMDPNGEIDAKDISNQMAWYQSQKMLKDDIDTAHVIDTRYAILLK